MSQSPEDKYMVDIIEVPKAIPSPKESLETMKGAVKGKGLARMKKEAVDCPVVRRARPFVECFVCDSYIRRMRGVVDCEGLQSGQATT